VRSGIEAALRNQPALILLDLHMPDATGFDFLRLLRKNSATRNIPVLVVSGSSDPKDEGKVRNLGAVDYVGHPVTDDRVRAAVRRILGPSAAHA
jgi:CheY-like chemotaxis protein